MQTNSESCVYVGGDDEVYGVQDLNDTSLFDEYSYYGAPQSPAFSGGYYFDNQEQSYEYGAYHYENYPVYYLYPTYPGYYYLTNPQSSPQNLYSAYYVYVPVNIYYYVPYFVYYLPTSTDNVNHIIYDVDSTQSYESDVLSPSMEQSIGNSQEFNSNFYDIGISSNEIVGEEQTTFQLVYEEYPEMLNDAPVDDEEKSECSNKKLEKDIVANGAEMNECADVGDQSYDVETNLCEDDVDLKLIKKISSLSIDDVKEDIDENYENAKAFVYNEVLKGYLEIKNQLEELDWECHSLEDILEEEEPESDSSEMDVNENVAEDLENTNLLPDEDDESYFESVAFSEKSQLYSNEKDLVEDHQTMMIEGEPSVDPSVVEEKDETDPVLELSSSKENICSGSLNVIEERNPPVDPSLVEEKDETDPVLDLSSSKENICSGSLNAIEERNPPVDPSLVEEKDETDPVLELSSSKENICSGSLNVIEERNPPVDPSLVEEKDETDPVLELSSSKENICSGSLNVIEERNPPVDPSLVEEKDETDPVLDLSSSKENICSGSLNAIEERNPPVDPSLVEQKDETDPVLELSSSKENICRGSLNAIEERKLPVDPSLVEEKDEIGPVLEQALSKEELYIELKSDPDIIAPAASKEIKRKKRFSGLRKFLARMCCCVKKKT